MPSTKAIKQINGKLRDEKATTAGEKMAYLKSERKEKIEKEKSLRAVKEEVREPDYANEFEFI